MGKNELYQVFAEFYHSNGNGLVNDRWSLPKTVKGEPAWRGDFTTPEYSMVDTVQGKPFEMNRGLGKSFGYNQMEGEAETITTVELTRLFVDVVRFFSSF